MGAFQSSESLDETSLQLASAMYLLRKMRGDITNLRRNVHDIVFDNKEQIPEGIYLQLMNTVKVTKQSTRVRFELQRTIEEETNDIITENNEVTSNTSNTLSSEAESAVFETTTNADSTSTTSQTEARDYGETVRHARQTSDYEISIQNV